MSDELLWILESDLRERMFDAWNEGVDVANDDIGSHEGYDNPYKKEQS